MADTATAVVDDDQGDEADDDLLDFDQAELQEAMKAAEEEGAGSEEEGEGEPEPDPQTQQADQGTPQEGGAEKGEEGDATSTPMIPKGRFDEVASQRDEAAREAAYFRGLYEGLRQSQPANQNQQGEGQQEQPPEPTPQEKIAAARQAIEEAAQKYDDGDLTTVEYEKVRAAQEDVIFEARLEANKPKEEGKKETATSQQNEDLYLDQLTAKLEEDHPYTLKIEDEGRWNFIRQEAIGDLQKEGVQLGNDARSLYQLRKRMAELTDRYGPIWYGEIEGGSQPKAGNDGGQKPTTTSQRAKDLDAKLTMSEQQPPQTMDLGSQGSGTERITEADIMKMTDDEIAALPPAVRDRLMGSQ